MVATLFFPASYVTETRVTRHLGNRRRRRSVTISAGRDADHRHGVGTAVVVVARLLVVVARLSMK